MLSHDNEINQQSDRDDVFGSLEASDYSVLYGSSWAFSIRRFASPFTATQCITKRILRSFLEAGKRITHKILRYEDSMISNSNKSPERLYRRCLLRF